MQEPGERQQQGRSSNSQVALPLLVASARPAHPCVTSELLLKCFTCESKQADPFDSQFSKAMFWRATRKHTQRMVEARNTRWGEKRQNNQRNI